MEEKKVTEEPKNYKLFGNNCFVKGIFASEYEMKDLLAVIEMQVQVDYWQRKVNQMLFSDEKEELNERILADMQTELNNEIEWFRSQHGYEPNTQDSRLVELINATAERAREDARLAVENPAPPEQEDLGNQKG